MRSLQMPIACVVFLTAIAWVTWSPLGTPAFWQAVGAVVTVASGALVAAAIWRRRWPPALIVMLLAVGLGCWRGGTAAASSPSPWSDVPQAPIRALVTVQTPVEGRGASSRFSVRFDRIESPDGLEPPGERVFVTASALAPYEIGDQLYFVGYVEPVDPARPFGRWLLKQGVVASAAFPTLTPAGHVDGGTTWTFVHAARRELSATAERILPQPHAALVAGLTLGSTSGMPEAFRRDMVASGTTHIAVVSGFNITVVGGVLLALFRGRRHLRVLAPLFGVWAFSLLAGASPPTIRAAVMATAALAAYSTGRGADALGALILAAALMCLVDPGLVSDLGFQLSAISTMGLIALQPRLAALAPRLHGAVREPITASLAAVLVTAPLLATTFHQIPFTSPLVNALIAPLIPLVTISGGIGIPLAALLPPAGPVVAALLVLPLHLLVMAIELSASLPGAVVPVGEIGTPVFLAYGCALLTWAAIGTPEGRDVVAGIRASRRLQVAGVTALSAIGILALAPSLTAGTTPVLHIVVLDVGHGDAIFLQSPLGRTVLIDGGPDPSALLLQLGRQVGLLRHGLDIAILTHAEPERLPGAVAAVERYRPNLALGPPEGSTLALYERWRSGSGLTSTVDSPTTVEVEPGFTIELFPTMPIAGVGRGGGAPRRALAVRIQHGQVAVHVGTSVPADEVMRVLEDGTSLRAQGLYVPRHGDNAALNSRLIAAIDPRVAVLSVGTRTRDESPTRTTLELLRDVPLYRTDLHGTIELHSDGTRLWVVPERGVP
jgi:competence protein ComEC